MPVPAHRSGIARAVGAALLAACAASLAAAQDAPPPPPPPPAGAPGAGGPPAGSPAAPPRGSEREAMWPAPTAEDWKKPCLITWQRTWEDAVAVSKETKKAILVCINMDGEIASEHWAGVRYRSPDVTKLYEPYVTVIASVYRHTPRDFDDEGNRVPCPRFGGVTCGEHISIEPIVYEKYLDGKRIAPRHIMVELDGKETYDVYYANDTASVEVAIREGIEKRGFAPPVVVRGDRPVVERVASRDVADRQAVEAAYRQGDAALRKSLLEAALKNPEAAQTDLLRLGVFGLDPELGKLARAALAKSDAPAATNLIADALRTTSDAAERDALLAALDRIGEGSPRAQWLAVVHRGLSGRSATVDVEGWQRAGGAYEAPAVPPGWTALDAERASRAESARTKPDDGPSRLALAESSLALAMEARKSAVDDPRAARFLSQNLFDDARNAAVRAEQLGTTGWRTDSVIALAAYYGGNVDEAYARAEPAVRAMPPGEASWNSMAVLTVYAESRWKAIQRAVREKRRWPAQWLTDLNAAYTVLLRHPLARPEQVVWHLDFLGWLGAKDQSARLLEDGIVRFPDSSALHERLRRRVLEERGMDALTARYDAMLARPDAPAGLTWHAAAAASIAADYHRRAGARDKARAAYERSVALHDRAAAADPARKDGADQAAAFAMASLARLSYEAGDLERSLTEILASFDRRAASAGSRDGMGFTPGETGQMLLAKLRELKKDDLVRRLEEALAKIDPELLLPDRP